MTGDRRSRQASAICAGVAPWRAATLASAPPATARPPMPKVAGYRYTEIMERLGVTYTNVNRHLTEARAELREAA
jgi:hypothetical protein